MDISRAVFILGASAVAAIKATQLAGIKPEIYFQEQDIQSRAFPATYYVDVTESVELKRRIISLYKCQNGPGIAARKLATAQQSARLLRKIVVHDKDSYRL